MSNIQTVREAVQVSLKRAEELYGVDMSDVLIRFDLKGAAAGMAGYNARFGQRHYYLRFNVTMINHNGYDHIINETVPHEVAHMVCFKNPRLGNNHDAGWARVCRALGGTGKRCHDEEVVYAKGKTYEYTCSEGTTIRLSEQRHNKIQRRGAVFHLRKGGRIDRTSQYRVVGISGRPVTQTNPKTEKAPIMNTTVETQVAANTTDAPVVEQPAAQTNDKPLTKAQQVRAAIARAKASGLAEEADAQQAAIDFAKAELGMKAAMAKRYVTENWNKA